MEGFSLTAKPCMTLCMPMCHLCVCVCIWLAIVDVGALCGDIAQYDLAPLECVVIPIATCL